MMLFVPHYSETYSACVALADLPPQALEHENNALGVQSTSPGDFPIDKKSLTFSGRVFLYHEDLLTQAELGTLETLYRSKNLSVGPGAEAERSGDLDRWRAPIFPALIVPVIGLAIAFGGDKLRRR